MNSTDKYIGVVQLGQFLILTPDHAAGSTTRLTSIPMQAAQPPESAELNLAAYEGRTIMVQGHDGGGWIYSAQVIDQAGPILTAVVERLFGHAGEEI
jgi:hypothetical protein